MKLEIYEVETEDEIYEVEASSEEEARQLVLGNKQEIKPTRLSEYVEPEKKPSALTKEDLKTIASMIATQLSSLPKPKESVEKVIERVEVVKEVEKKDTKKYAEDSTVQELKKIIEEQNRKIQSLTDRKDPFGGWGFRTGKIIPSLSGQGGKYLTNNGSKLDWATVQASGGGSSSDVYTVNNVTTDRTLDANDTSLDQLSDFVASLVQSLQGAGIIQ